MTSIAGWWPVAAVTVMVTGQVVIVWLVLRKTDAKDVPKTVTALAELFRWWRLK